MVVDFAQRVQAAVASVRSRTDRPVSVGVVLGSGLSDVVDGLVRSSDPTSVAYADIEGFGAPSVSGHRGSLVVAGSAAILAGRFHYYEGRSMDDVVLPVATLCGLGARVVVLTNAAGGINPAYAPGDLVLIRDHLNLMGVNPLVGPQAAGTTARFPDMTEVYDADLRSAARRIDGDLKDGVYAALTGPSYETPAEITMLARLGADLVGMSTVPEAIVARSYGVRVLGISTVTNLAAGLSGSLLDHSEVVEVGRSMQARMVRLLGSIIDELSG